MDRDEMENDKENTRNDGDTNDTPSTSYGVEAKNGSSNSSLNSLKSGDQNLGSQSLRQNPDGVTFIPGLSASQISNSIIVNRRQQGNPVLKNIRNLRWVFADIVPDYVLGSSTCALFISLRYHMLHPNYLYFRIRELQKAFRLRVVLCFVDLEDVVKPLHEVTKITILNDCTLFCGWSFEECARYLETLKSYEKKPADHIQEKVDNDYISRLINAITAIPMVNKTDAVTLGTQFGSVAQIMGASMEDLEKCPGIGDRKVKRLYSTFHEPFRRRPKKPQEKNSGFEEVEEDQEN